MTDDHPAIRAFHATTVRRDREPASQSTGVPVEAPLAVEVNGIVVAHLMRLPGHDAELALGFCLSEGLILGMADLLSLEVCPEEAGIVRLRSTREVEDRPPSVLISACVGGKARETAALPDPVPLTDPPIEAQVLLELTGTMRAGQQIHHAAGSVHAAAAFSRDGELLALREDVGRHNAVDKVVGHCLYQGCPMDGVLATTGRASSEMLLKAAAARFPIAVSLSGPTSLGVELAEKLGVTLICYARGSRMTVYTHTTRVAGLG